MPRRLGVIGTFVWDTVHPWGHAGPPIEQWGGVSYSLHGLAGACPGDWEVVPVVRVGTDLIDPARALVATLPNLAGDASLVPVPEPNNRVTLHYRTAGDRDETLTGGVSPWTWEELAAHLAGLDALYVNHLSGMEMPLEVAESIREQFQGPIYADFHSLFLAEPGAGPRRPRTLPDAERWLATADVIQLNREEFALLAQGLGGVDDPGALVGDGLSALLVTSGADGAAAWTTTAHPLDPGARRGAAERVEAPLHEAPASGDPTGCGDIWGAVTLCRLLSGAPLKSAMDAGNRAAAAKVRHGTIDALYAVVGASLREAEVPGRVP